MTISDRDPVIVDLGRSPIGRAMKGSLVDLRPDDLAAQVISEVVRRSGVDAADIEDVVLGCGFPEREQGLNIARRAALLAGLDQAAGVTVNRFCASSLQATAMAAHAIRAGEGDVFVVGGVESVTRTGLGDAAAENPVFEPSRRRSDRLLDAGESWTPARQDGLLPDTYISMGDTAEFVARLTGTGRAEQDAFAAESQRRAVSARDDGFFEREIIPVTLPDGIIVRHDDGPRPGTTVEKLSRLQPVFRPVGGTVTAGNSCPLNDGAAAAVVTSGAYAREHGLAPLARILTTGLTALDPEVMGLGPVEASRKALARAGLSITDMDIVEINEAFAAQVVPAARQLGVDFERQLNPHGGAIALGHPFGATGVRMLATLHNGLRQRGGRYGLATMCIGGGQGMAMVIEAL